jgi:hypothetical protein
MKEYESICNSEYVVKPEKVQALQARQESGRDVVRERAFKLFYGPIELVWADSLELIELRPQDSKVEVMAKINPHENKEGKIWSNERMVEII